MLPDVWNVAEPLEVEYWRPIHQSSDQSNSDKREIVKPLCAKEIEGQENNIYINNNDNNNYDNCDPLQKAGMICSTTWASQQKEPPHDQRGDMGGIWFSSSITWPRKAFQDQRLILTLP